MKTKLILLSLLTLSLAGCASFSTTQLDQRKNEKTGETATIKTVATSRTFFDSKSALANFKASQTEKTQSASVGSLSQESQSPAALLEAATRGVAQGFSGKSPIGK